MMLAKLFCIAKFLVFNVVLFSSSANVLNKNELQDEFSKLLKWEPSRYTESYKTSWFQETVPPQFLQSLNDLVHPQNLFANRVDHHRKAVGLLTKVFREQKNVNEVLRLAGALRNHPQIHPKLWVQAFILAKVVRDDMKSLRLPSLVQVIPDDFLPIEIFDQASNIQQEDCIVLDENFTNNNGIENDLWYFREDLSLNSHHGMWHIYYAGFMPNRADRRGELFYFMHHEFLNRYATERMTAGLRKIDALGLDYVTPMEGYSSHLTDRNSNIAWGEREPNITLKDIRAQLGPGIWVNVTVDGNAAMRDLIVQDINAGFLIATNGTLIPLDGFSGIELLSDAIEASQWVINPERYSPQDGGGGFHNEGHALTAYVNTPFITDPSNLTGVGVMVSTTTSMRDPIFYRVHTGVENLFLEHKNLLTPYTPLENSEFQLSWNDIRITDVKVIPENQGAVNELKTFWNHKQFNFSRGLDFMKNKDSPPVAICSKHLDHTEFDYEINVEAPSNWAEKQATVRIFMARRYDENLNRFSMEEQRKLFFSLDQFSIKLNSGTNRIVRNSRNSSLTIPFESWVDLGGPNELQHCGCGWPHHLLLPRGSATGTAYDIFVMVTPEDENTEDIHLNDDECRIAPLWCGVQNEGYPSRYPLGYPFDRRPYSITDVSGIKRVVANLDEYIQGIPNMGVTRVRIQHLEN